MDIKPIINYDDFSKVDLRVVKIISAERVDGSDKLIKLEVSLAESKRQIIAGLGKKYQPEELIDKSIVIVANLEPRTLMGLTSEGMVLAADSESGPVALTPLEEVISGTLIK